MTAEHRDFLVGIQDPFAVLDLWLTQATESKIARNPNAMALATADSKGRPSVRMVLLKSFAAQEGYVVFYTNYGSRKGIELAHNEWAAATLHWDAYGRQIRLEGRVTRSPAGESDAYYNSRPLGSRLNAWASQQSQPIDDIATIKARAIQKAHDLGLPTTPADLNTLTGDEFATRVPRPPSWGGFRLWCTAVELWTEGDGRFHERLRFERELEPAATGYRAGAWSSQHLQP